MGLLHRGTPLPWHLAQKEAPNVRKRATEQFIRLWKTVQTQQKDCLKWGDEIEHMILTFQPTQNDEEEGKEETEGGVKLVIRGEEILEALGP